MSMAWEPDRRSNSFFSPPAHLCDVTYMTEISLIVTLNNHSLTHSLTITGLCFTFHALYEVYIIHCAKVIAKVKVNAKVKGLIRSVLRASKFSVLKLT